VSRRRFDLSLDEYLVAGDAHQIPQAMLKGTAETAAEFYGFTGRASPPTPAFPSGLRRAGQ
jgi:hypothetical protein